ncbi:hypothetical protein [Nocardia sp. NPDC004260]
MDSLLRVARAYSDFAVANPALYDAARRRGRGAGLTSVSARPAPVAWGYG